MHTTQKRKYTWPSLVVFGCGAKNTNWFTALVSYMRVFIYSRRVLLPATWLRLVTLSFIINITCLISIAINKYITVCIFLSGDMNDLTFIDKYVGLLGRLSN
jgi:hypothetical protein